MSLDIYCDGSCHVQKKIGVWCSMIYGIPSRLDPVEIFQIVHNTTSQFLELQGAWEALRYLDKMDLSPQVIRIFTDSQYLSHLPQRYEHLKSTDFRNKQGKRIPNWELVASLLERLARDPIQIVKIKAHQKKGISLETDRQRLVDKRVRFLMRRAVKTEKAQ